VIPVVCRHLGDRHVDSSYPRRAYAGLAEMPDGLSDADWRSTADFLPMASSTARRREWPMREIVNAISMSCAADLISTQGFSAMTDCLPWFACFRDESVFERMNYALVMADRNACDAEPARARLS
jgi:hypothetical protein